MKKDSRAFVNHLVVCALLTIGLGGGAGLGVVWMRHQISSTANQIRKLGAERSEVERLITEKNAAIASAQAADKLRLANESFRLGLVPMSDVPLFNESSEAAIRGLVLRANQDLIERSPTVTLKLARN